MLEVIKQKAADLLVNSPNEFWALVWVASGFGAFLLICVVLCVVIKIKRKIKLLDSYVYAYHLTCDLVVLPIAAVILSMGEWVKRCKKILRGRDEKSGF